MVTRLLYGGSAFPAIWNRQNPRLGVVSWSGNAFPTPPWFPSPRARRPRSWEIGTDRPSAFSLGKIGGTGKSVGGGRVASLKTRLRCEIGLDCGARQGTSWVSRAGDGVAARGVDPWGRRAAPARPDSVSSSKDSLPLVSMTAGGDFRGAVRRSRRRRSPPCDPAVSGQRRTRPHRGPRRPRPVSISCCSRSLYEKAPQTGGFPSLRPSRRAWSGANVEHLRSPRAGSACLCRPALGPSSGRTATRFRSPRCCRRGP
jgi:hypothetical protein